MRFESLHPAINLMYFLPAFVCIISFNHPALLFISYICTFIYSVLLNRIKGLIFNLYALAFIIIYPLVYAGYNHFGVTTISFNVIGNRITLESLVYGLVIAVTISSVLMLISCIITVMTADKISYLIGRFSPVLSLYLSIILRMIPRILSRGAEINCAQKGVGRGYNQGGIIVRIKNFVRIISILITWTLESFFDISASMKSRGYMLKHRSAFSIYRFDNRDRIIIICLFFFYTAIFIGVCLNQTKILYNPKIIFNPITEISVIIYILYAIFLLLPSLLHIAGEIIWERKRAK